MLSATHMIGGAAAAAACLLIVSPDIQPASMALATVGVGVVGGLIPDIDHPKSKISHTLRPVNALVSLLFSHRGFFHTPVLYGLLYALFLWKCPAGYIVWGQCLFAGIASHIFLDCLNPGGIPLFLPLSTKRIHLAKIHTGGKGEEIVRVLLTILTAALLAMLLLDEHSGFIVSRFFA